MQHRQARLALVVLSGAISVGPACATGKNTPPGSGGSATGTGGGSTTSSGGGSTTSTGGGSSSGGGSTTSSGGGSTTSSGGGSTTSSSSSGSTCKTHCSADLHSVLDCNDQVVTTCSPTQGCGTIGCVSACDSAQQNQSTIGCEYYAINPEVIPVAQGACFAAFIANTWTAPATIQVERAGVMLNAATFSYLPVGTGKNITYTLLPGGQLMPGQVAIVFLAGAPTASVGACPAGVNVGFPMDASVHGTGLGYAFHISTSVPVSAYDVFPYGGGQAAVTSATLLIPTITWDTNYIAIDAYAKSVSPGAQPNIDIVAAQDNTTVTINPSVAIVGGNGVAPAAAGTPTQYHLDKGRVLQLSQTAELVGSVIKSDQPIGLWGGASCFNIPVSTLACDSGHQQIPPIRALGHEYVAARYRNRFDAPAADEVPPWRIVGAVDGTSLVYDPAPPTGAPVTLDKGQLAEFRSAGGFSVTSQDDLHPFYMSAHMTGCQEVDPLYMDCRGDPEFVNLIPPQQYLSSYVFFTDPTYPETNLVIIRSKGTGPFQDVVLDCAGTIGGWQPVGAAGAYEYARIDLVRNNFQGQNGCDNGRHEIHSAGAFGLTVWGWGTLVTGGTFGCYACSGFYTQAVSYAYPAGASVQHINPVVLTP